MLDDAVYYSRREQDEIAAAKESNDPGVRQIHLLLADKYRQLAQRALAALPASDASRISAPARSSPSARPASSRRFR
jgi:hypothetical protein